MTTEEILAKIEIGMTVVEVKQLLGEPDRGFGIASGNGVIQYGKVQLLFDRKGLVAIYIGGVDFS